MKLLALAAVVVLAFVVTATVNSTTLAASCSPGHGKNLSGCVYDGKTLNGADFHGANLYKASFVGTSLVGATFRSANLGKANFTDADLTGAKLGSANIGGTIFCHTIMPDGSINDTGC